MTTGHMVIHEELENKTDEIEIVKQSNQSLSNILKEQQLYAEEMKEEFKKFKGKISRQDRELETMKHNAEGSSASLYTRISILEQEIEDLRNENQNLNRALKKTVSEQGNHRESTIGTGDLKVQMDGANGGNDIYKIESKIEMLKQNADMHGSYEGFFRVFEEYKSAVGKEMLKMKKNLQVVRQENDGLKSMSLELKRKDEQIDRLKHQIDEIDDDHAIIKNANKAQESSLG